MNKITGILLAAGSSSRFGSDKLLHPLPDGTVVGIAAARNLSQVLPKTIAVIRPGDQDLMEPFSQLGLKVIENPLADEGMSTSIAAGISASLDADGWVIALADMPWVKPESIELLLSLLQQGASIAVPEYEDQRGNPVGFNAKWKDALCSLSGDKGARDLIESHSSEVMRIDVNDEGVLRDVDVLEDINSRL